MKLPILKLCKSRGISLTQLARLTGISRMTLWRCDRGLQDPSLSVALLLAKNLGVSLQDFVSKQGEPLTHAFQIAIRRQVRQPHIHEDKSWVPLLIMSHLEHYRNVKRVS